MEDMDKVKHGIVYIMLDKKGDSRMGLFQLLQKPPGSVADPDDMASLFSHDQTGL
jgi:hypothetical protein